MWSFLEALGGHASFGVASCVFMYLEIQNLNEALSPTTSQEIYFYLQFDGFIPLRANVTV